MSKASGMGSKRAGSHTNKGMGKCMGKKSHQCGDGPSLSYIQSHEEKHKKHGELNIPNPEDMPKGKKRNLNIHWDEGMM